MLSKENLRKVSYCVLAYNQENYIEEAVLSVLAQKYSSLEIIISDDCSTDNTYEIIQKIARSYIGEHKLIINRNLNNLGIAAHFSKVYYTIASGDYIIGLGGDDIAKANHVEFAVATLERFQDVNMIDFNGDIIDKHGQELDKIELNFSHKKFDLNHYLNCRTIQSFAPGRILRRNLIESFDPISKNCPTEDSVFVLRSLLAGGMMRVNKVLIYYRKHDNNVSSQEGLMKLSNRSIISQYLKDVLHYYDAGFINNKELDVLIKRIQLELKIRELFFSKSRNKYSRFVILIRLRLLKLVYKFKINFR